MLKDDDKKSYTKNNMDQHYLVIIDNMVRCKIYSIQIHQIPMESIFLSDFDQGSDSTLIT